jgi:Phosphoenolpyruvate phosphomutase
MYCDAVAPPEPKEIDETRSMELRHLLHGDARSPGRRGSSPRWSSPSPAPTRCARDCVYPIALWESDALRPFISEVRGPVNVVRLPQTPSLAALAALGVARVSWATLLYRDAMARFEDQLASLQG